MTDVNFCTLTILCCYYIYRFHETGRLIYFLPVFIFSTLLILVRQFGIIVPVCFMVSCVFVKEKKWRAVLMALLVFAAAFAMFKIYEGYLHRILPKTSTYKFSQNFDLLSRAFWDNFFKGAGEKWSSVLLHILIYLFPFALVALIPLYKRAGLLKSILISVACAAICFFIFRNEYFPYQNIFTNMKVGPETLYQSFQANHHAKSEQFQAWMNILKIAGTSITATVMVLLIFQRSVRTYSLKQVDPLSVFLICALLSYIFMLFITESYFDRYNLPLIVMALILLVRFIKTVSLNNRLAFVPLIFMFYVSVAGTKDYFTWNEKRWEAYYFLRKEHKVPEVFINAGFEVSCWTDRDYEMSFHFGRIDIIRFLVQFDPEEGFVPLKEYEFQRYFPYKKDKINIFVRQAKK
jgi:4-amino-4-deoxy-L-arabinose transferase-like glycosyltransferase